MIPEPIERTRTFLSNLISCGADVRKVQNASPQVPGPNHPPGRRPLMRPASEWHYQVRVRIEYDAVPRRQKIAVEALLRQLHDHLIKSGLTIHGVEKTPLGDHRVSILLPQTYDHTNDPFNSLFPMPRDAHPELRTIHAAPRLQAWFEKLKKAATLSQTSTGGEPVVMSLRIRTRTGKEKDIQQIVDELDRHVFEQNDGVPPYHHIRCVERKQEPGQHRLVFHFPNIQSAMPIFNTIEPHGGYH